MFNILIFSIFKYDRFHDQECFENEKSCVSQRTSFNFIKSKTSETAFKPQCKRLQWSQRQKRLLHDTFERWASHKHLSGLCIILSAHLFYLFSFQYTSVRIWPRLNKGLCYSELISSTSLA